MIKKNLFKSVLDIQLRKWPACLSMILTDSLTYGIYNAPLSNTRLHLNLTFLNDEFTLSKYASRYCVSLHVNFNLSVIASI